MENFVQLFNKVEGKKILQQYNQGHVFLYALFLTVFLGFDKKSLEILRLAVGNKLLKKLRRKYKSFVINFKKVYLENESIKKQNTKDNENKIWVCWFQGLEQAPEIVQMCYESLQHHINKEIILITDQNYEKYVQFPKFIKKKIKDGIISKAHMSDLLRLELLYNYGGTWIDATVFFSGSVPAYMLDSELFVFQNLKPGLDGHCTSISNWFITAKSGNKIIKLTLALLYEYWRKNNKLIDYFIFHDFFQIAIEAYPDEWKKVVPVSNAIPHILLLRLFDEYDELVWKGIQTQGSVHKLTYKFTETDALKERTYYRKLWKMSNDNREN